LSAVRSVTVLLPFRTQDTPESYLRLKILLAFFARVCAISRESSRRAPAAIRYKKIPNAGA